MAIDLNADLGEGCANDEALLALVSSANIACGYHAGDADTMRQTVRWAMREGVAIGAHPSFPDRENFGRTKLSLPPETIYNQILYQLGALQAIVACEGAQLVHVKPHGMLYNQAAVEPALAEAIARAVYDFNPRLRLVGLAGSALTTAAEQIGLVTRHEVFADRRYQPDGTLVPRSQLGAVIEDEATALAQTLSMVREGRVQAINGSWVAVRADSVCLHGDGAHALVFAQQLRHCFQKEGIIVRAA